MANTANVQKQEFRARLDRAAGGGAGTLGRTIVGVEATDLRGRIFKPQKKRLKSGLFWWMVAFGIGIVALMAARKVPGLISMVASFEMVPNWAPALAEDYLSRPYVDFVLAALIAFLITYMINMRGIMVLVLLGVGIATMPVNEAGGFGAVQDIAQLYYSEGYLATVIADVRGAGTIS